MQIEYGCSDLNHNTVLFDIKKRYNGLIFLPAGKLRADDITLQRVKEKEYKKEQIKEKKLNGQSEIF